MSVGGRGIFSSPDFCVPDHGQQSVQSLIWTVWGRTCNSPQNLNPVRYKMKGRGQVSGSGIIVGRTTRRVSSMPKTAAGHSFRNPCIPKLRGRSPSHSFCFGSGLAGAELAPVHGTRPQKFPAHHRRPAKAPPSVPHESLLIRPVPALLTLARRLPFRPAATSGAGRGSSTGTVPPPRNLTYSHFT